MKFVIKSIYAYIGFDCTAKSLHVGSLLQIMILRLHQKYGTTNSSLGGGQPIGILQEKTLQEKF